MKTQIIHESVLQDLLVSDIESTVDWRAYKATEYPEDAYRNRKASEMLYKLLQHVESLDDDHELFTLEHLALQYAEESKNYSITERISEKRNYDLRAHGFQDQCSPEEWVQKHIDNMRQILKSH